MVLLSGKILLKSVITAKTGLRVGGTTGGLKIGGVDLSVITDPEGRPYIPGSSLKGKMRSLMEKKEGVKFSKEGIHLCREEEDYRKCPICKIWGTLPGKDFSGLSLTRLFVRDTFLDAESITKEMKKNLDLAWTEVKMETAINRVTGTAQRGSLRQIERVPAGARFKDCEMVFNVFEEEDKELFKKIFEAMEILEDDYLGGMGSRGYGKIAFSDIRIYWNRKEDYESGDINRRTINEFATSSEAVKRFAEVRENLV